MLPKDYVSLCGRQMVVVLAMLAANLLAVACLWNFRGRSTGLHSGDLAAIYFSQGQLVLLAAWCAWGTGRTTTRWLVALASLAAIALTFNHFATRSLGTYSEAFFGLSVGGAVVLGGWYVLFLPLRWLLGWRLTFNGLSLGSRRGQFRLRHWLGWTAALGLPLAVARLLYPGDRTIECLFFCGLLTLPAIPLVVISFRTGFSQRPWHWSIAAVLLAIAVGVVEESLVMYCLMGGGSLNTWQVRWMQIQQTCGMNLGLLAGLLGNLLILRLIGLRFVSGRSESALRPSAARWDELALASAGSPK